VTAPTDPPAAAPPTPPEPRPTLAPGTAAVALGTAAAGFQLGVGVGGWQVAVESAQVLAGLVTYPPDNPFRIYHVKLWTLCTQIPAAFLAAGVSDETVSLAISGLMGAMSLSAIALCTLALSGNRWFAAAVPMLCCLTGSVPGSPVYPLALMGTPHTYGAIGTSFGLLALGLIGCGAVRTGALMAGLAPAVHPPLGAWTAGVAVLALAADPDRLRNLRVAGPPMLAGALPAALSRAVQLWFAADVPRPPADEQAEILAAFVNNWDAHRQPVPLIAMPVMMAATVALVGAVWWAAFADDLPPPQRFLLRALTISAALAMTACVLGQWPEHLPSIVNSLMPGRYTVLTSLALPAFGLGLVCRTAERMTVSQAAAIAAAALLVLQGVEFHLALLPGALLFWAAPAAALAARVLAAAGVSLPERPLPASAAIVSFAAVFALNRALDNGLFPFVLMGAIAMPALLRTAAAHLTPGSRATAGLTGLVAAAVSAWAGLGTVFTAAAASAGVLLSLRRPAAGPATIVWGLAAAAAAGGWLSATAAGWSRARGRIDERRSDPVYAAAADRPGLLLAGPDLWMTQGRCRRPILLDGMLNQLPYAPESGPPMNRILREVYGVDLLRPPPDVRLARETVFHPGFLLAPPTQRTWESRPRAEWIRLGRRWGFTEVAVTAGWRLDLPVAARSPFLVLYRIPDDADGAPAADDRAAGGR
jgi:hypothetical protein